ncbi:MAG: hypothetical protein BMS9Abin13_248 [Patescibacteria group bacterium]|nr:MAG: hypothetical protein BMS9Abin13_248 [Patescibacteria group bacterium]
MNELTLDSRLFPGTVSAIIFRNGWEEVLAVMNLVKPGNWYGLPGGGIEEGETVLEALDRESREEAGPSIHNAVLISVKPGEYHHSFWLVTEWSGELNTEPGINPDNGIEETDVPQWLSVEGVLSQKIPFNSPHRKALIEALKPMLLVAAKDDKNAAFLLIECGIS